MNEALSIAADLRRNQINTSSGPFLLISMTLLPLPPSTWPSKLRAVLARLRHPRSWSICLPGRRSPRLPRPSRRSCRTRDLRRAMHRQTVLSES